MNSHMRAHTGVCNVIVGRVQKFQACVMTVLQVLVFYFVRCVLAFSCCVCELYFYK